MRLMKSYHFVILFYCLSISYTSPMIEKSDDGEILEKITTPIEITKVINNDGIKNYIISSKNVWMRTLSKDAIKKSLFFLNIIVTQPIEKNTWNTEISIPKEILYSTLFFLYLFSQEDGFKKLDEYLPKIFLHSSKKERQKKLAEYVAAAGSLGCQELENFLSEYSSKKITKPHEDDIGRSKSYSAPEIPKKSKKKQPRGHNQQNFLDEFSSDDKVYTDDIQNNRSKSNPNAHIKVHFHNNKKKKNNSKFTSSIDTISNRKSNSDPHVTIEYNNEFKIENNISRTYSNPEKMFKKKLLQRNQFYLFGEKSEDKPFDIDPLIKNYVDQYFKDRNTKNLNAYISLLLSDELLSIKKLKKIIKSLVICIKTELENCDFNEQFKWLTELVKNENTLSTLTIRFCCAKMHHFIFDDSYYTLFVNEDSTSSIRPRHLQFLNKELINYALMLIIFFREYKITLLDISTYNFETVPKGIFFLSDLEDLKTNILITEKQQIKYFPQLKKFNWTGSF